MDGALARYPVAIIYLGSCTRQLLGVDASGLVGNSSDTLLSMGAATSAQDTRIKGTSGRATSDKEDPPHESWPQF